MNKRYATVSGVVFGLIAIGQALRAFNEWPVQVGSFEVPVGLSWIAAIVAGSLCAWGLQSTRR